MQFSLLNCNVRKTAKETAGELVHSLLDIQCHFWICYKAVESFMRILIIYKRKRSITRYSLKRKEENIQVKNCLRSNAIQYLVGLKLTLYELHESFKITCNFIILHQHQTAGNSFFLGIMYYVTFNEIFNLPLQFLKMMLLINTQIRKSLLTYP